MKTEIHTLRFGDAEWIAPCAESLESWCKQHRYQIFKWDDSHDYETPKLVARKMLEYFLKGDADRMIYVDADVFVHAAAPGFPEIAGLALATDAHHHVHDEHFREWVAEHYGVNVSAEWQYSNAGVWSVDRPAAKALLARMKKTRFVEFFQEQHWFNYCAHQMRGMVNTMPSEWNRAGKDHEPSWFFHLWGDTKLDDLQALKVAGFTAAPSAQQGIHSVNTSGAEKTVVLEFIQDCGLGNQMFEWAAGYSIAKSLGLGFTWMWKPSKLREFSLAPFGIAHNEARKLPVVMQKVGQGSRRLRDLAIKRISDSSERFPVISCPFQDEQCFIDHADDVAAQFATPPVDLPNPEGMVPVGVQVRRGDYLAHSRLNVTTPDYFTNAMRWMKERIPNAHFIVVSDDPKWCSQFFGYREDVTVMPPQPPEQGIATLASCEGHIISNSTFGWWGAWLGERRHGGPVVVPEVWHHGGKSYGQWEPIPPRWNRVEVGARRSRVEIEPQAPIVAENLPKNERAIVYPYHADQEKWHELRYSLRSVDKHFEDKECPIYILGTRKPGWLIETHRVKYVGAFTYREALSKGVQMADEVLWMNDDIILLRDTSWDDCRRTLYLKEVGPDFLERAQTQSNPWREGCVRILRALAGEGIRDQRVYSTHTPYVYKRDAAMAVLRKYGMWEKFPMELAYFHHHAVDPVHIGGERATGLPFGDARFLNHSDHTLSPALKREITERFAECPPWEARLNWGL